MPEWGKGLRSEGIYGQGCGAVESPDTASASGILQPKFKRLPQWDRRAPLHPKAGWFHVSELPLGLLGDQLRTESKEALVFHTRVKRSEL